MEKNLTEGSVAKTIFASADISVPMDHPTILCPMGMVSPAGFFLSVLICTVAYVLLKPGQKS